jgi:hypothetical protein
MIDIILMRKDVNNKFMPLRYVVSYQSSFNVSTYVQLSDVKGVK